MWYRVCKKIICETGWPSVFVWFYRRYGNNITIWGRDVILDKKHLTGDNPQKIRPKLLINQKVFFLNILSINFTGMLKNFMSNFHAFENCFRSIVPRWEMLSLLEKHKQMGILKWLICQSVAFLTWTKYKYIKKIIKFLIFRQI